MVNLLSDSTGIEKEEASPNIQMPTATTGVTLSGFAKQLANGKYEYVLMNTRVSAKTDSTRCNHTCKDKTKCKHLW